MNTTTVTTLIGAIFIVLAIVYYQNSKSPSSPLTMSSPCTGSYSDNYCAPLIGCFAQSDLIFEGRSNGFTKGQIVGKLSSGATCTGDWSGSPVTASGSGSITCDDKTSITVHFQTYDRANWVIVGKGKTDRRIIAVSPAPAYRKNLPPLKKTALLNLCHRLQALDQ